ncbi:MAG: hypothetical protein HY680_07535, partial [Chloroflexi bacterium]|nr:hypothetical protein [Chloroflexota bacterium]
VLKPQGNLVLAEPLGPRDEQLRQVMTEAFQGPHPGHRLFSPEEVDKIVADAGFREVRGTEVALAFHQEGIGGVPMGPHILEAYHLIRMRKDARLLEKFNEEVLQVTEAPGGKVFIHGSIAMLVSVQEKRPPEPKKASEWATRVPQYGI